MRNSEQSFTRACESCVISSYIEGSLVQRPELRLVWEAGEGGREVGFEHQPRTRGEWERNTPTPTQLIALCALL